MDNWGEEIFIGMAQNAYHAYGAVTDWKNYQGLPMPEWEQLTEKIQRAWIGATKQVIRDVNIRDPQTGFVKLGE